MKLTKLLALLLALTLVFTLAACGNGNNDDPSGSQQGTNTPLNREDDTSSTDNQGGTQSGTNQGNTDNTDLASLLTGLGTSSVVYSELDEATKQQLKSMCESAGMSITFGADGTTTIVDDNGDVMTQNADGTWSVSDGQGGQANVGSKWPDNEFTKLVPKPDFEVSLSLTEGDRCAIQFGSLTAEDLRAYAEKLKSAGFTVDAETTDEEQFGTWIYTYSASNANGVEVELSGVAGSSSLIITSPNASQGGDNQGGGNTAVGKQWSTDKAPAWNGSGSILDSIDLPVSGYSYYHTIYINKGTIDELNAYVATLKNAGFTYRALNGDTQEPATGYEEDAERYRWSGYDGNGTEISIALFKDQQYGATYKYYLAITVSVK